jgi:aspartate/methionine/tyrosine aminotransferase
MPELATGMAGAPPSGIRELANAATGLDGAIRLDLGQPDFPTPEHIVAAAKRALDEGWTGYTQTQGLRSLRELLAEKVARRNGYRVSADDVTTAPGGVGVIAGAFAAVLQAGDEVLLPDPAWPNYELMAAWTQSRVVRYPCPPELGFQPDLDRLRGLFTPRTRLLVVNSPNNPTGALYPEPVLRELVELASRNDVWLLSDECYDEVVHEGGVVSPASLTADPRVISAYSFSKTYAMTGWRLGYLTGPRGLVATVTKVLESQSSCAPSIAQKAAEAALAGPQDCVRVMNAAYRRRRDAVVEMLRAAEMLISVPRGAFYVMADVSPSGLPARDFAFRLLRERGVSVAPGSAFGDVAGGAVRISLASSDEDLAEGVGRLCDLVARLAGQGGRGR